MKNLKTIRPYLYIFLILLITIYIFSNSCKVAVVSTENSDVIVNYVSEFSSAGRNILTIFVRKFAHIAEFFLQSVSACLFLNSLGKFPKNIIYILFGGLFTACCDEFIQLYVDGRAGLVTDIFLDFAGTCVGILFCVVIYLITKKLSIGDKK